MGRTLSLSMGIVDQLPDGGLLHVVLQVLPAGISGNPEHVFGGVLVGVGSLVSDQCLTGEFLDGTNINNTVLILNSATVTLQAIPEPSCFAVFGIGACGLVLVRRRRTATQRSAA